MFPTKQYFEKTRIKMIGHHARLRDVMSQTYPFMSLLVLIARASHRSTLHFDGGSSKQS